MHEPVSTCGHEEDTPALKRSRITKTHGVEIDGPRFFGTPDSHWMAKHDSRTTLAADLKPGTVGMMRSNLLAEFSAQRRDQYVT